MYPSWTNTFFHSYANDVDAVRLPSYSHRSRTRRTGLAMWAASVSLSATMLLAQLHHQRGKKMLLKVKKQTSNSLVSHLPPHKLLCLYMPKVSRHPQLPTSLSFCNTFLFIVYCAYWCAVTSSHVRQNSAPSRYPLVRGSKYPAHGFLQFTCSKASRERSQAADVTWRSDVEALILIRWANSPSPVRTLSNSSSSFLFF